MTREPTAERTTTDAAPRDRAIFLVWGPPSHGPRSRVFARELGIEAVFVYRTLRRGPWVAPLKYGYQAIATVALLRRRRPSLVMVQSPPSLAVMVVAGYCALTGAQYVVDAHSDAMLSPYWTRPRWLHRLTTRRAALTIVTNEHFASVLREWGGQALVLRDVPTSFTTAAIPELDEDFSVVVVNTFAADEPLDEVLTAASHLPEVTFHVTGNLRRAPDGLLERTPRNVNLTGFLADADYYALLAACDAVMCLTTRDHTMQRGACEALSLGRPIITSDWPLLRDYFSQGTIHVDNTEKGIRGGITRMREDHPEYVRQIAALQAEQRREWETARRPLLDLLDHTHTPADR